ncbi:vitamin B12-transporter protein BtuF [Fulvivirga sp. RKSG066]|uniref:ABC transporter substrate-binding protein n=1 Tax=Fulvivirga aurantia TaxID=2529383 RepID=UPI0012BBC8EF|nr:ABC transporter substrate-binding protein [Fulvivirga aurantia]MTI22081.1 vitamin B12-transporter protein BtuF [Fulvivirga aurantia]
MKSTHLLLILNLFIFGCSQSNNKQSENSVERPADALHKTSVKYAEGFTVSYKDGAKWVEVPTPYKNAEQGFKYLLVQKGDPVPKHDADVQVIEVPIEKIVCTSTTHIPLLNHIDETSSLVGFPTLDYISSEKMRQRIDSGKVMELGVDKEMNLELLVSAEPELVMAYTMSNNYGQFKQMQNAGVPVVINAEYIEPHPLGRAEWIKFMALFFNKEKMADSVFSEIERNYTMLKEKVKQAEVNPSVLSGVVYGDTWYLPGGRNYAAKILRDAGGNYIWSEDSSSSYLELSFEAVYEKANDADFWIGVASYESLKSMTASDERYANFEAFKQGNVYTYSARKGAKGGNIFLELGYLRPDLILSDLVKILHPELIEDQELYFHAKLN